MKPEKCAYCGDMVDIPFECTYCKDPFCDEHRLPEDHRCVKLTVIRAKKFGPDSSKFKKFFGRFR